ncbi:SusC/RagA family TonB-linked outer membrane protein [Chitinophaga vietnamensis]|uniref:SusC/RagA family TonB-linked outer membrane protein n=1 Tax=Chitinophaga vietnamensis TaxID=2593957 RepID=UPI001177D4DA|nr:SusC/RagA family TonB-linked outer membrane protein [Chitinophaga vietnamensis]
MNQSKLLMSILALLCLLCYVSSAFCQNKQATAIKIIITDSTRTGLPGATIMEIGGAGKHAVADNNGKAEILAPLGSRLKVSMTGYQPLTIIASNTVMNIVLKQVTSDLKDVVVLGYATQKKSLVTGSVATMKVNEERRDAPTTSMATLLAGQMPGVNIGTPSGIPGTMASINIRTASSWNGQPPLFVIDGVISSANDFNNLSPNEVDNISVLKDAAAAAVYGSRSAGGVVVVTTIRGKSGIPKISYSFNTGFDKRGRNAPLTSAIETGEIYNRINPNSNSIWTASDFDYFKKINNGWGYSQLDAVWKDPYIRTHNLNVSGGTDKVKYFVGGSYTKQGGTMTNLTYEKYNVRANLTAQVTDSLQLFAGLSLNNNLTYGPPQSSVSYDVNGLYRKQLLWQPEQPVWTKNGNPIDYGWIGNVGAEARGDGGYLKQNYLQSAVNLKLTYHVPHVPGLYASAQYNKTYNNYRSKYFETQYNMWVMKNTGVRQISTDDADVIAFKRSSQISKNFLEEDYNWYNFGQYNFQIGYEQSFRKHHVQGMLIYEGYEYKSGGVQAGRDNFPVYLTDQWWATSTDRINGYVGGRSELTNGRRSWVGQAFYDYAGKYLATFAYRYDGSMNFAYDKRWGLFPSGSAGWVISEEPFFKHIKSRVDFLKLRASVGLTGNDLVGGWQWQQSYQNGNSAYFGTSPATNAGITYGPIVNEKLTWEKSLSYNAGVDAHFLDHFNATLEYYNVKTYDILGQRIAAVPPTFSRSLPSSNYGQMRAQGMELVLGYENKDHAVKYYANINASYGGAKYVIKDENITYPYQKTVGHATNMIVTREAIGILRDQAAVDAFLAAHPGYTYYGITPKPGQIVYQDISGPNGKPDGIIDDWDLKAVKPNNNPVYLGLNFGAEWKGISVSASFSGRMHQWRFVNSLVDGNVEWNRMWEKWYTDGWTPTNTNASLPIRYSANDDTRRVTNDQSTFWLKNAAYLRLSFLSVGYSLPGSVVKHIGLQGVKFYFSGSNLFVISKFNKAFYDPEMVDGFSYPIMKTFNFGAHITL